MAALYKAETHHKQIVTCHDPGLLSSPRPDCAPPPINIQRDLKQTLFHLQNAFSFLSKDRGIEPARLKTESAIFADLRLSLVNTKTRGQFQTLATGASGSPYRTTGSSNDREGYSQSQKLSEARCKYPYDLELCSE